MKSKKRYHKKSQLHTKVFQVCIGIGQLFWNLALILVLHCYCGDNVKYGPLSKHLFQRKRQYGG